MKKEFVKIRQEQSKKFTKYDKLYKIEGAVTYNGENLLDVDAHTDTIYVKRIGRMLFSMEELKHYRLEDAGAPDRSGQSKRLPFPENEHNRTRFRLLKGKFTFFA